MKSRSVKANRRRRAVEVTTSKGGLLFPFSKLQPKPTLDDPIARLFVDKDLGSEGSTFVLASGKEGTIHIEQVLEYNRDPDHLRDAAQFYRLLDQTNYSKSVDQMLSLLQALDCDVELVVRRAKSA